MALGLQGGKVVGTSAESPEALAQALERALQSTNQVQRGHRHLQQDQIRPGLAWYCSGVIWPGCCNMLGLGVGMSMAPMGVAPGVIMGVAPIPGVAAGVAPRFPAPAGVSSHRERPRLGVGVAPTAGVSPGAQPGVAAPSTCTTSLQSVQPINNGWSWAFMQFVLKLVG